MVSPAAQNRQVPFGQRAAVDPFPGSLRVHVVQADPHVFLDGFGEEFLFKVTGNRQERRHNGLQLPDGPSVAP